MGGSFVPGRQYYTGIILPPGSIVLGAVMFLYTGLLRVWRLECAFANCQTKRTWSQHTIWATVCDSDFMCIQYKSRLSS